ncbi:MAG: HAD family phosphatase [Eubacterium sp.]|nr:HAD family phosphatase [Candidatus Colimonas fimequi]
MGKVIFYDVDGTLFRRDCGIPESTMRAMRKCEENGHRAILCTGRAACTLPPEVDELPLHGRICQCGTYVLVEDQVMTNDGVEGDDCQKILDILREYDCPFFVENSDHFYLDPDFAPGIFEEIIPIMEKNYPGKFRHINQLPGKLQKLTGYPADRSKIPAIKEALAPWFVVIDHDEYDYIEITHKDYTKGSGVAQVLEALGIDKEDAIAFGDSANDISMLDAVGMGIVMGDAPDYLKEKYTATDSIYADGIEKALIHIGLID